MALTRAMLKGMGLTEEQVSAIIEEHISVTSALKEQVKEYKADAEKLPGVQKELDDLKKDTSASDWEKKYNDEHTAFEAYKKDISDKENSEKIRSAYKKLLAECNVGDKHIDSILKVTDFSNMKLGKDGTLDGADKLKETISADWSGFISTKETKGADVDNPPGGSGNPDSGKSGRAAELAAKYHDNLYGKVKEG